MASVDEVVRAVVEVVWQSNRSLKAKEICTALAKRGHHLAVPELNRLLHSPATRPPGLVYEAFSWSYDPQAARTPIPSPSTAEKKGRTAPEFRHPDGPSTKRVVAAVTPTEHEAWSRAAAHLDVSLSDLVRQSVAYYLDARRAAQDGQTPPRTNRVADLSANAPPPRSEALTQIGMRVPQDVVEGRRRQ